MEKERSVEEKAAHDFRAKKIAERAGLTGDLGEFAKLETPYEVEATQEEGERALAALAGVVQQEYAWIYDKETSLWSYQPTLESTAVVDYQKGTAAYSVQLPQSILCPDFNNPVFYHIHPTSDLDAIIDHVDGIDEKEAFLIVSNQLPKGDDITTCVALTDNGYESMKVVAPLGVTTVTFDRKELGQTIHFPNLELKKEMIAQKFKEGGYKGAVSACIDLMNKHYGKAFHFAFREFEAR